jgi:uncharacterized membrane protein
MTNSHTPAHDPVPRAVAIVGLLGIGLIHLLDSIGKYSEVRYVFWLYIGLIVGTIVVSGMLLRGESRAAWAGAGLLSLSALVGYVLSRTTGLPSAKDDIGNWTEPLGLASLFVEGCLVALAGYRLAAQPALLQLKGDASRATSFSGRPARVPVD